MIEGARIECQNADVLPPNDLRQLPRVGVECLTKSILQSRFISEFPREERPALAGGRLHAVLGVTIGCTMLDYGVNAKVSFTNP